jgi:iron complex transport system ATP-binding protein
LNGYSLSAGVLNQGDLDAEVATALGAPLALEQPFSPVRTAALDRASGLIATATAAVLTPVPFGTGNLANLALLEKYQASGRPVFIATGIENRDYTPSKEAVAKVNALLSRGAIPWRDVAELTALLRRTPCHAEPVEASRF